MKGGEHEPFMRQAVDLAARAKSLGNHPFGALLVHQSEVVLTAQNSVVTENDQTCHAELNLVSLACRQFPPELLRESILYTSTEPCAMCAGAIYWAGIPTVVYGCGAEKLVEMAGGGLLIPCRQVFAGGQMPTTVIGPLLEEEAVEVHKGFWK